MPSALSRLKSCRLAMCIVVVMCALCSPAKGGAVSFELDSIAAWGKFPRFIINTYRWGDKFFNGYDSTYVVGTGYKFNAKMSTDSWLDYYHFKLPNKEIMTLQSDPSTTVGAHLGYLAVSVGYEANIKTLFHGIDHSRTRYNFGFNCSLLAFEFYWQKNNIGTKLTRFGDYHNLDMNFDRLQANSWGFDSYYFFNHKKYSQAAAFNFSRVQKRSQGTLYAGISYYVQEYDFDFSGLPEHMKVDLPAEWTDYKYNAHTKNYCFRLGYGYNWVFAPHWLLGVSESPIIGVKHGIMNSQENRTSFSMFNRLKASISWNNGRWFAGLLGYCNVALIYDRETTFAGANFSVLTVVGYRFNLW